MCCPPALVALYKVYQLSIVDQVKCDGPIVKGKHLLQWMMAHVVSIDGLVKLLYLVLKELDKQHRKAKHQLNSFSKP